MKYTLKSSKEELKNVIGSNVVAVKEKDKNLFERLVYADKALHKDEKSVGKKDLLDLVKDIQTLLGDKFVIPTLTPVAENAIKKGKKSEPVEKEEDNTAKKSDKKSEGVTVLNGTEKTVPLAEMFPEDITVDNTKYSVARDIKTMKDLHKALESEEDIVFAYYWTERHLKQFEYFNGWLGQPEKFADNLDIAQAIYVSEKGTVAYQVSLYTESVYTILPKDLKEIDGLRVANGIEFQIYKATK